MENKKYKQYSKNNRGIRHQILFRQREIKISLSLLYISPFVSKEKKWWVVVEQFPANFD